MVPRLVKICSARFVHELVKRAPTQEAPARANHHRRRAAAAEADESSKPQAGLERLEEVQKLLARLPSRERQVVRLYYLEGRTYEEISTELNLPVGSIGPILSRARQKMRKNVKNPPPVHRPKSLHRPRSIHRPTSSHRAARP